VKDPHGRNLSTVCQQVAPMPSCASLCHDRSTIGGCMER
jgi:hypothetical protein